MANKYLTGLVAGLLIGAFVLAPMWVIANHSTLRVDPFNAVPVNPSGQTTAAFPTLLREQLEHELSQTLGRLHHAWVYSGGVHATAGGLTSASFATEAFVPERVNQTATAITYPASANDICWTIISSDNNGITGWTRVGTTAYYVKCQGSTTPTLPALPANSAYLMRVTVTGSAIAAVAPVGPRSPIVDVDVTRFPGADIGAQINAAIAAMPDAWRNETGSGGAVLRIPPGTHSFSTPIVTGDRQSFCLEGAGSYTHNSYLGGNNMQAASHLVYTGAGTAITIGHASTPSQGVCLRNFKLTTPSNAINVDVTNQVQHLRIEGVHMIGPTSARIGIGLQLRDNVTNCVISQSQIENYGTGILLGGYNNACMFIHNQILRNDVGMHFSSTFVGGGFASYPSNGVLILGNAIEINDAVGIDIEDGRNISIIGNYFEGSGTAGGRIIRLGNVAGKAPAGTVINANYLTRGGAGGDYAIALVRASDTSIMHNSTGDPATVAMVHNPYPGTPLSTNTAIGWNDTNGSPAVISAMSGVSFLENHGAITANAGTATTGDNFTTKNNDRTTINAIGTGEVGLGRPAIANTRLTIDGGSSTTHKMLTVMNNTRTGLQIDEDGRAGVGRDAVSGTRVVIDGGAATTEAQLQVRNDTRTGLGVSKDGEVGVGRTAVAGTILYVDGGSSTGSDMLMVKNNTLIGLQVQDDGIVIMEQLKTTGAATGKSVVCVDLATGRLYASSTGTDCSN